MVIEMSEGRRSYGVIDGDPIAIILFIYMSFVMIFWFSQNVSFNPIAGNTTTISNISAGYNNLKWFLALIAPIGGYIIMKGWNERSDKEE